AGGPLGLRELRRLARTCAAGRARHDRRQRAQPRPLLATAVRPGGRGPRGVVLRSRARADLRRAEGGRLDARRDRRRARAPRLRPSVGDPRNPLTHTLPARSRPRLPRVRADEADHGRAVAAPVRRVAEGAADARAPARHVAGNRRLQEAGRPPRHRVRRHRAAGIRPADRVRRVRGRDHDPACEGPPLHRFRDRPDRRRGDAGVVLRRGDPARRVPADRAHAALLPRRRRVETRGAPDRRALCRRLAEVEPPACARRRARGRRTRLRLTLAPLLDEPPERVLDLERVALRQPRRDPRLEPAVVLVGVVGAGDDDHDRVGEEPRDLRRGLEPSGAGHRAVDHDRVGPQRLRELHRPRAVAGVADHAHVVRRLEEGPQRPAKRRVIVDEENGGHERQPSRRRRRRTPVGRSPTMHPPMREARRRIPGLALVEHELEVPLDHADPGGETITVFTREVIGGASGAEDFPLLVFFQGGPGHEAGRPVVEPPARSWMARALREFRVLLLDQRGTGRSTPVGALDGRDPAAQAAYLTYLRADSIVRDAELVREALGVERWSIMGQSFGGFCVLSYLSFFPEALREAFVCGGLPPIGRPTDDVYARTYPRVLERCAQYYLRYPDDRGRVRAVHRLIGDGALVLPTGEPLTTRRFRQLGLMLGMSDGAERLHAILERPPESPAFLHDVATVGGFARNPLYAAVHEACYADGCVTGWAAERLQPHAFEDPELFTGEHVYSWMFEDYAALRPLRE